MNKILCYLFGSSLWMAAKRLNRILQPGEFYLVREEITKNITGHSHDFIVIIYGVRRMDSGYGDSLASAFKQAIHNYRQP